MFYGVTVLMAKRIIPCQYLSVDSLETCSVRFAFLFFQFVKGRMHSPLLLYVERTGFRECKRIGHKVKIKAHSVPSGKIKLY